MNRPQGSRWRPARRGRLSPNTSGRPRRKDWRRLAFENLESRTVLAAYTFTPAVDAVVADRNLDGVFETVDAAGTSITDRWSPEAAIGQERGVFEFNLASVPSGTPLTSARLGVHFTSNPESPYPQAVLRAYAGDGSITADDGARQAAAAGMVTVAATGYQELSLDLSAITPLLGGWVGIRLENTALGAPWISLASREHLTLPDPALLLEVPPDFGDAPDTGVGTAAGNYNTLLTDNGPRHGIDFRLFLGASVDSDPGTLQNASASADDVDQAAPDDEDGVAYPAADLTMTIGSQPTVNVTVTNTTGTSATLWGWIDYNRDGVFDNGTERAQAAVPNGSSGAMVTLTFPTVPGGSSGSTYSRFRLSTDASAANPTGAATDGEVEDYVAKIVRPTDGEADHTTKIAHITGGGPALSDGDGLGASVAAIGDLNDDGVVDLAVGVKLGEAWGEAGVMKLG